MGTAVETAGAPTGTATEVLGWGAAAARVLAVAGASWGFAAAVIAPAGMPWSRFFSESGGDLPVTGHAPYLCRCAMPGLA